MLENKKRVPLARFWTTRYLVTLLIGLIFVGFISATWIRHTTITNRLDLLSFMADEFATRIENSNSSNNERPTRSEDFFGQRDNLMQRGINPTVYLIDTDGVVLTSSISSRPPPISNEALKNENVEETIALSSEQVHKILKSEETIVKLRNDNDALFYAVKQTIEIDQKAVGTVILVESKEKLGKVNQEYGQLAIGIGTLALLGLLAIYILSRRLSKPIKEVANAAKQVQEGNYHITLKDNIREQEIYELIQSFKEMANRLEQLESTRTELLAGVTHELKTPVTSISGLLQALKDGVVTGEEAISFIEMALTEATKMKTMVGDLLAFNSFAVDAIPIKLQRVELHRYLKEIMQQWDITNDYDVTIHVELEVEGIYVNIDCVRFQQIITNLLTNATQAMAFSGDLYVTLRKNGHHAIVTIKDTGKGIPKEEQPFIFERFYRGENKKYSERGLGLGLALSKMMAQSLNGALTLKDSSSTGTTFELILPSE